MRILTDRQYALLAYIDAAERGGYHPSTSSVMEWLGDRLKPSLMESKALWQRPARQILQDAMQREDELVQVKRFGWVQTSEESGWQGARWSLTELGRAMLKSTAREERTRDSLTLAVDDGASLAVSHLNPVLVDYADALLVDPALDLEQVVELALGGRVRRVIMSDMLDMGSREAAGRVLEEMGAQMEVRITNRMPGRYLIGGAGNVAALMASSREATGRSIGTLVVPLPLVAARAVSQEVEKLWSASSPLFDAKPGGKAEEPAGDAAKEKASEEKVKEDVRVVSFEGARANRS